MKEEAARPIIIAGPCMAESYETMERVLVSMLELQDQLGFEYYFKASFDKANRSSGNSARGPGLAQCVSWFSDLKSKYGCKVLTDIHLAEQAPLLDVCDVLQIPAFLCRQTDLLLAAAETGKIVNIKKGQFVAPAAMKSIVGKVESSNANKGNVWVTERGFSFGYGDLIVDMRGFHELAKTGAKVIFDITHSTQTPIAQAGTGITKARREIAPLLARSAAATSYLDGFFLEVHPNPEKAQSDADAQLSISQAQGLLRQLVPLWRYTRELKDLDPAFA